MQNKDIRWVQRFSNYKKALDQLLEFLEQKELNKLEEQGLIKAFEYTYELAWTTLKDFMEYRGTKDLYGSRDVIREAFKLNLIEDGEVWMDMIQNRNKTIHTYNKVTAEEISYSIRNEYSNKFVDLENKLSNILAKDNISL